MLYLEDDKQEEAVTTEVVEETTTTEAPAPEIKEEAKPETKEAPTEAPAPEIKEEAKPETKEAPTEASAPEEVKKAVPTKEVVADKKPEATKPKRKEGPRKLSINRTQQRRQGRFPTEFEEKVVDIARVTTVVKGGRRFSFSALVVVGNKKGKVGYGHGKANEVPDAIRKAIKDAKRNLINVPIIDKRTVPHDQVGRFLSSNVMVKPAPKGKGIIASGSVRSVVELAGYKDIYTKSLGSRSKANTVKATIEALKVLRTAQDIAKLRDIDAKELVGQ